MSAGNGTDNINTTTSTAAAAAAKNFNREIYEMTVLFGEGGKAETIEYLGKLLKTLCHRHIAASLELNEQRSQGWKGHRTMSVEELLWPLRHDPIRFQRFVDYMCAREVLKGPGNETRTIEAKGGFYHVADLMKNNAVRPNSLRKQLQRTFLPHLYKAVLDLDDINPGWDQPRDDTHKFSKSFSMPSAGTPLSNSESLRTGSSYSRSSSFAASSPISSLSDNPLTPELTRKRPGGSPAQVPPISPQRRVATDNTAEVMPSASKQMRMDEACGIDLEGDVSPETHPHLMLFSKEWRDSHFTHKKLKNFKEWLDVSSFQVRMTDEIYEALAFITWELLGILTQTAILTRATWESSPVPAHIRNHKTLLVTIPDHLLSKLQIQGILPRQTSGGNSHLIKMNKAAYQGGKSAGQQKLGSQSTAARKGLSRKQVPLEPEAVIEAARRLGFLTPKLRTSNQRIGSWMSRF